MGLQLAAQSGDRIGLLCETGNGRERNDGAGKKAVAVHSVPSDAVPPSYGIPE